MKMLLIILAVLVAGAGIVFVANQSGGDNAKKRDQAFLQSMVPHHESAIAMAQVAKERATTPEIKKLAGDIVSAQETEIAQMRRIHERLFGSALTPDEGAHEQLGLSASEAGMNHGAGSTDMLRTANPFDQAFIDEMIPHHEGAIRMAKALLETTKDTELRQLAQAIVTAQEKEVTLMSEVRTRVYGTVAPTPSSGGGHSGHGGM